MDTTRRSVLRSLAVLGGAAAITWKRRADAAAAKATKASMKYQEQPHDGQQCSTCLQFIPGKGPNAMGQCKVVDGAISPKGWCIAYAAKKG